MELASSYGVARVTVRTALDCLEREGLVLRFQGRGTFAAPQGERHSGRHFLVAGGSASRPDNSSLQLMPLLHRQCFERGIRVTSLSLDVVRFAGGSQILRMLREDPVDGVLLVAHCYYGDEVEIELFRELGAPLVLVHGRLSDSGVTGFSNLYFPWHDAVEASVRHLTERGLTRFVSLTQSEPNSSFWMFDVSRAEYLQILERNGADADPALLVALSEAELSTAGERFLALRKERRVDAALCQYDLLACSVYQACAAHGIRIPEEAQVMSACCCIGGELLTPSLSTIDLQYEDICRMAVEYLLGPHRHEHIEIPTPFRVVCGASTGAARPSPEQHLKGA